MKLANLIPILGVADVGKTIKFYEDALKFEVKNTYEHEGILVWAFLQSREVELMVEAHEEQVSNNSHQLEKDTTLYFYPDDVEELHALLKTQGYPVSDRRVTFYGMKEFHLQDPNGYLLCFGQETDESPTA